MIRALETLSPKEVLALAIHVEQANAERFRTFAGVFQGYDPEVVQRFLELAAEEEQHEKALVTRFVERFGQVIPAAEEVEVPGVIEAPDLDESEHLIFDSLKPRRVYELALEAELGAQAFYRKAAAQTADPGLLALYRELGEMEGDHVSFLEKKLRNP